MTNGPTDPPEGWSTFHDEGFIDLVGPLCERWTEGKPRAFGFRAGQKHANLLGLVHGGMLMTLADRALGVASWDAAEASCVTIQFDMQFVSSAKIGEFVALQPEIVRLSSSLVFTRGDLTVDERTVAVATGVWKILKR
ncbi:PaaI family thioesterase [Hansschlegelia quercus]|uniref:PaaI family thioesterase n=1 Tax=Hansschlegelia quercus TaxID=2528245 RepID=A0A4Q9GKS6_9HYPH|nr:PaaI family thioesterase [Hansschlegelia quercus]TBN54903.1 PaaI family thioesterase [Hansschlegelia quercus]